MEDLKKLSQLTQRSYMVPFGPNANCTFDTCPIEYSVYGYRPALGANITFVALFSLALIIHVVLGLKWKSWWFMWCMVGGCADEILGYAARIWMFYSLWNFNAFMIQIVCITTAPVFYCAAIYVLLAKTVSAYGLDYSRFSPKLFYWVFIPCDIVSLVLQGAGGALSTNSKGANQVGVDLALAGLAFQVFTLFVFVGVFVDYLVRYYNSGTRTFGARLKIFYGFVSLAIALIFARCAFRVDELSEGYSGHLVKEENLFIGLEGVLITLCAFALCIGNPGFIFQTQPAGNQPDEPSSLETAKEQLSPYPKEASSSAAK